MHIFYHKLFTTVINYEVDFIIYDPNWFKKTKTKETKENNYQRSVIAIFLTRIFQLQKFYATVNKSVEIIRYML